MCQSRQDAGKDGVFTLYEDEGTNYNYEKGMLSKIKFIFRKTGSG
ncbi:MAG: DUF5110 domain-containing protein [Ferruginibacter sp.]